jgi:myo-inositol 2-dehydrogenase/D-chiro-inositol 1-dehydrogenase
MRLTLIGAGRIGANHARVLAGLDDVTDLAVADVVAERARVLADATPGGRAVGVDEAFDDVDAVVIATSTDTHAALLEQAAAAGIAVFCEKPISLDLDSSRAVVTAVDEAGITVQMGFQRRYEPAMRRIHDAVASGELGTPYLVRSQTHDPEPPPLDYLPVSGGIFRDCLIHDIDVVRFVTGQEVKTVTAVGAVLGFEEIGAMGDVDTACVVFGMSEGTLAQLSALRHDPVGYDVRLEVFGSGASLAAGWSDRSPIHSTEPGVAAPTDPIRTFMDRFAAAFRAEMEAFVRVVRGEEQPASNHHDAHEALRVAVACDRSLAEGRTVEMEEIE